MTKEGARNLSSKIPKTVAEIEKVMAGSDEATKRRSDEGVA